MFTLAICTHNINKVNELNKLLPNFKVCLYQDIVGYKIDVVEDGSTFEENAIKKVDAMPLNSGVVYLSDDSGLEVDAFNGEPGIHSARLGGANTSSIRQCELILERLGNNSNRGAQFTCVIALRYPDGNTVTTKGIVRGVISNELMGEKGFGYDPIFIPEGYDLTFSQLGNEIKNTISHRYRAICDVIEILENSDLKK
jgi:XTP/dITP diphosphohydrolase